MTLPHNIERRLYRNGYTNAPYRAWDGAGRVWFIAGPAGQWSARCRDDEALPVVVGATLARVSAKLGAMA